MVAALLLEFLALLPFYACGQRGRLGSRHAVVHVPSRKSPRLFGERPGPSGSRAPRPARTGGAPWQETIVIICHVLPALGAHGRVDAPGLGRLESL